MDNDHNIGAFVQEVLNYDLSGYNPYAMPPMTAMKREMIAHSESDLDQLYKDFLNACSADLACLPQFITYIENRRRQEDLYLADHWETTAKSLFNRNTRLPDRDNRIRIGGKLYRYRALRNVKKIKTLSNNEVLQEIEKNGPFIPGDDASVLKFKDKSRSHESHQSMSDTVGNDDKGQNDYD